MSNSAWNQVYDRSLHDLLDSEREVRTVLEGEYRKIVALLEKLAQQHYGPTLEDQRRAAPEALQKWSAQDWENFFQTAPRTTQNQLGASQAPNSWGKPTKKLSSNGNRLEKQLSRLQEENQQLQAEVLRLQAEISAIKKPPEKAAPPKPVARQLSNQAVAVPGHVRAAWKPVADSKSVVVAATSAAVASNRDVASKPDTAKAT